MKTGSVCSVSLLASPLVDDLFRLGFFGPVQCAMLTVSQGGGLK